MSELEFEIGKFFNLCLLRIEAQVNDCNIFSNEKKVKPFRAIIRVT